MLFRPTSLLATKTTFFFPSHPPPPFYFCLPTDEATAKSVKNNSPTDSEMQTATASKDKGFLTKSLLCQKKKAWKKKKEKKEQNNNLSICIK